MKSLRFKLAFGLAAILTPLLAAGAVACWYAIREAIGNEAAAQLPPYAGRMAGVAGALWVLGLGGAWLLAGRVSAPLREREQALRASEEKFSKAFQANPDLLMISRLSDGLIVEVNEGFECLTGYAAAAAVGRRTTDLHLWHDVRDRDEMVRRLRREGWVRNFETRFVTAAGAVRHVLVSTTTMDLAGEPHIIGSARDVTELKQAQEGIRRLNEELEQRVRSRTAELESANRELESFSYSVSHDLRAPLRAIAGYARILGDEHAGALSDEARGMLERINRNAIRMGELIDDLLDFSRTGRTAINKAPLDMGTLVAEVRDELLAAENGRRVDLRVDGLPGAAGERSLLRQVWVNLIANALKFTRDRHRAVIEIGGERVAGEVRYFVRDNGIGFDPQYADKLFHVFQRLHRDASLEGTGVGLAIVHRIVQCHGGRVWAESVPEGGAVFHFSLPADEAAA